MSPDIPIIDAAPAEVTALVAEILTRGSAVRVRVTGTSMKPLVPSGARVLIRQVPPETLRCGDIVYYKNALGEGVLHRIVRVDRCGRLFRTKGDALIAFDDPVSSDMVLGRAVRIERRLPGGRCWRSDLDSRCWRRASAVMGRLHLAGAKVLLGLRALAGSPNSLSGAPRDPFRGL